MSEFVIEVRNLTKNFGDFKAVDSVDLLIKPGTLFGFLGANGAGKTTTIRILSGLMSASSGSVTLAGIDVLKNPEESKKRIGYMSQRFSLYRDLSSEENLEFFGGLYGSEAASTSVKRRDLLGQLGLAGWEHVLAGNLPGGLAQRLGLCCAMSHRPAVLFLDEPTAGVDPASRRRFWNLIHELAEEGTTVVVTTHYLDEAEYCDDIVLMHAGRIVATGGPDELKRQTIPGTIMEISGPEAVDLEPLLEAQAWILETSLFGDAIHIQTEPGLAPGAAEEHLNRLLPGRGSNELSVVTIVPTLEDVFLRIVDESEGQK